MSDNELSTDILIVGGTTGGVAAALAATDAGARCVVVESTDWIGGQLTSQAVPPDENRWVETTGATTRYQSFRDGVRAWYRASRPLTPEARHDDQLNPGNGWVSRLCCEPSVAHTVLRAMLEPAIQRGLLTVLLEHQAVEADVESDRLRAVTVEGPGGRLTISARYVLDASDLGDLLPLADAEHRIGSEHVETFGELHGHPDRDDPVDQQGFCWCFALENVPGDPRPVERPAQYDFWKQYVPQTDPAWCGPLFSWEIPTHDGDGVRTLPMVPWPDEPDSNQWELWRYRRIRDASLYREPFDGAPVRDISLINWVQMDYWQRPLLGVDAPAQELALREAREQSLSLVYWLQNEAPRHDGSDRTGYPDLRLRGDVLGTSDGIAKAPYIREARRLVAETMVTEAHVGAEQRRTEGRPYQDASPLGCGELFEDSVGIGHYSIDFHPSCSGRGSLYVPATPYRIPLGALIPVRLENLIAAGKCLGVSHVANGCFRLHPVEWNIGEAAGALAARCLRERTTPRALRDDKARRVDFQAELHRAGVRLAWPWEKGLAASSP